MKTMQTYSNPEREGDAHALPDVEVFQLTATEAAEMNEDACWEAHKLFPLASMNSREREKAIDWIVETYGVTGGYYWQSCFPGCLPDGEPNGPFETAEAAKADAQSVND